MHNYNLSYTEIKILLCVYIIIIAIVLHKYITTYYARNSNRAVLDVYIIVVLWYCYTEFYNVPKTVICYAL